MAIFFTVSVCKSTEEYCILNDLWKSFDKYQSMCPKSCSVLEYTGFVDFIGSNGIVYNQKPNETYFSLTIRYKPPAMVTLHEEYLIIDFYGMVGVVGGTLGLFVGFSIFDVVTYVVTFFQKIHKIIHKRNPDDNLASSKPIVVKECHENMKN